MIKKILGSILLYGVMAAVLLPLLVTLAWGGFRHERVMEAKTLYHLSDFTADGEREAAVSSDSELEQYVMGVVSAEMPALFPKEALKAQAVAARTYQIRKMREAGSKQVLYDVGQAYATPKERREKWGSHAKEYEKKVAEAVRETKGEIMVYEAEPILAVFHAQSSGKTEDSENVWVQKIPYLRSVDSSGDLTAPNHEVQTEIGADMVLQKLSRYGDLGVSAKTLQLSVKERTRAGYIRQIAAGRLMLTGKEVREALGLRSADFTVEKKGDTFLFVTEGYGHGAGMSQHGAAALAEKGMSYHDILSHYYTGISFEKTA